MNNRFYLDFPPDMYNKITITPESNKNAYLNFVTTDTESPLPRLNSFKGPVGKSRIRLGDSGEGENRNIAVMAI